MSILARLTLAAAFWCLLTLGAAALALLALFQDHLEREAATDLDNQLVQLVRLTEPVGGAIRLRGRPAEPRFEQPFSGWAWQIRREGAVLLQSASLGPPEGAPILAAPVGGGVFEGPLGGRLLGVARDVAPRLLTERLTYAVARPQDEIEAATARFRGTLLIALAVLGAGQVATVILLMRAGLRPLSELRARVAALRAGLRRPGAPVPREIAPVAEELDGLADHVERLATRARGHASDLAHAIKTPLTVVRQISEGLSGEDAAALRRQGDRIQAALDRHLARIRSGGAGYGRAPVAACVEDLATALSPAMEARGLTLETDVEPCAFIGDEHDLFELIGNPLDNAGKWAKSRIRLTARLRGARLIVSIEDDGPGIPEAERGRIFERGHRLDEAAPGDGLGLAIVKELTALHEGRVTLGAAALGGLSVRLELPGAPLG